MCQSDAQQHERRDDEDNSLRVSLDFATLRYIGGNAKARETQRLKIAVYAGVEYKCSAPSAVIFPARNYMIAIGQPSNIPE